MYRFDCLFSDLYYKSKPDEESAARHQNANTEIEKEGYKSQFHSNIKTGQQGFFEASLSVFGKLL